MKKQSESISGRRAHISKAFQRWGGEKNAVWTRESMIFYYIFFFFFWNNTTVQPPFLNLDWAWNLLYAAKLTVCQFRVYALRGLSFVCMRALNGQIRKSNYLAEEIT